MEMKTTIVPMEQVGKDLTGDERAKTYFGIDPRHESRYLMAFQVLLPIGAKYYTLREVERHYGASWLMEDAMKAWRKVCTYAKEMRGCEGCIYQHSKHEAPCVVEWLYAEA